MFWILQGKEKKVVFNRSPKHDKSGSEIFGKIGFRHENKNNLESTKILIKG